MAATDWAEAEARDAVLDLEVGLGRFRAAFARRHGIGTHDLIMLGMLATRTERLTPHEIAEEIHLSSASITTLLDRVERAGLARRAPNARDRRSVFVDITPAGRDLVASFTAAVQEALDATLATPDQLRLLGAVRAMAVALDDRTGELERAAHRRAHRG